MPYAMAAPKLTLQRDEGSMLLRPDPLTNYSACGSDFRSALFLSIACSRLKPLTVHSQTRPHAAASPAFSQKNPLSSVESAATMMRGTGWGTQDSTAEASELISRT